MVRHMTSSSSFFISMRKPIHLLIYVDDSLSFSIHFISFFLRLNSLLSIKSEWNQHNCNNISFFFFLFIINSFCLKKIFIHFSLITLESRKRATKRIFFYYYYCYFSIKTWDTKFSTLRTERIFKTELRIGMRLNS